MDVKVGLALVAVAMTVVGYFFYFRDIFANKTKPHAFSWLVWASLTGIAFFGQLSDNAGPGAWVTAVTAVIAFIIFALAIKKGEKDITRSDKLNLLGAGAALVLWFITSDPLLALDNYTLVTWLYPASLVAANLFFVFMLVVRRRKLEPVGPF